MKKNGLKEWIFIVIAIVSIIAGICFGYQSLTDRVGTTEKTVAKVVDKVEILDTAVTEMKKDVFYIKEGVSDLKEGIETLKWGIGLPSKSQVRNDPNGE